MAEFDCFSPGALGFLRDLKANNTKDWFAANKKTYETELKDPGKAFADAMARALGDLTGHDHTSKIFRIHRDVRFSKDKTPYNAHLHIAFTPEAEAPQPPMWFFGLAPDRLSLGCGVFQYDKGALDRFRTAMAGPKGADLIRLAADLRDSGVRVNDPDLKRVPPGFDKDHPNGEALRRKGFSAWMEEDDPASVTRPDLVNRTARDLARLMPVFRFLYEIG